MALGLAFGAAVLVLAVVAAAVVLALEVGHGFPLGWWSLLPVAAGVAAYLALGVAIYRWFGRMFQPPQLSRRRASV